MESNTRGRSALRGPVERAARKLLRRLAVGANVHVGRELRAGRGAIISAPHSLTIGDSVSIGPRSIVQVDGEIGDFTMIGMHVQIVGRNDHAIDEVGKPYIFSTWVGDREARPGDAVHIGRDVWVGGGSIILSGVSIGEGALIGAGSVVTSNVQPYTVFAGSPARFIRRRFEDDVVEQAHSKSLDELSASNGVS